MPFKSKAQRGYLFVHNPKVAKEFAAATPKGADLPEHVGDKAPKGKKKAGKKKKKKSLVHKTQERLDHVFGRKY